MKNILALLLLVLCLVLSLPAPPADAGGLQRLGDELQQQAMQNTAPETTAWTEQNNVGQGIARILSALLDAFRALFEEIIRGFREGLAEICGGGLPPTSPPVSPPTAPPVAPPTTPPVAPPVPPAPPVTPPAPPATPPTGNTPTAPTDYPGNVQGLIQAMKDKFGVTNTGYYDYQRLKYNYDCLSILPESFRKRTTQINHTAQGGNIAGYVYIPETRVHLTRSASRRGTLVHEMTHTWQGGNMRTTEDWAQQFWGTRSVHTGRYMKNGRRSVSNYGNTNPLEDMAESVMHYVFYPDKMKISHPDRYAFVKQRIMGGVEYTGNEFTDWKN